MWIPTSGLSFGVQSPSSSLPRWSHPTGQDQLIAEVSWSKKEEETLRGCCRNQAWIRGDRWVRSAQISPTWKDRMDRQPDATRVLRLSHETVRWQASQQRLCSIWQFCLRCNSQSQKPVKSDISLQRAFFHFAKCIHRSSGWVNFNQQLPSILYYLWHSNTLLLLLKLVCVKEQNYLLNTGSVDWINGWPRRWPRRWTGGSEKVPKYGADSKKKKKPWKRLTCKLKCQQNNHIPAACHITGTTLHWTWWVFFCNFVPLPF